MPKMLTTIPAQPGFELVVLSSDEFCYYPIVAWVVEVDADSDDGSYDSSVVYPVTTEWECNRTPRDVEEIIIRNPSGKISFIGGPYFLEGEEDEALKFALSSRLGREEMKKHKK